MWPLSKSTIGRRSTTSAFSRLTRALTWAGRTLLNGRISPRISFRMMPPVRPAKTSDSIWWRPAKASSSWKSTADRLAKGTGLSHSAPRAGAPPGFRRPRPAGAALFAVPEVRQPGDVPPAAEVGVVAPLLGVAQGAFGHGVAVDHADLDLAHRL